MPSRSIFLSHFSSRTSLGSRHALMKSALCLCATVIFDVEDVRSWDALMYTLYVHMSAVPDGVIFQSLGSPVQAG